MRVANHRSGRQQGVLYADGHLSDVLDGHMAKLIAEVDALDPEQILGSTTDALADHFTDRFTAHAPVPRLEETTVDQRETKVDVSQDFNRAIRDRSRPVHIDGTQVNFFVPFDGDGELFRFRPSGGPLVAPAATVSGGYLVVGIARTDHNPDAVRQAFEREMSGIQQLAQRAVADLARFNEKLRPEASQRIERRRRKLLADRNLAAGIGFPLRSARDSILTVPVQRKQIRPLPRANRPGEMFAPEYVIEDAIYNDILATSRHMAIAMERSPATFAKLTEEEIRDFFLMSLNGKYDGAATGETFNGCGKTDILIRHEGKNLFIAECKVWHGPEAFKSAIDQLLGYSTWRDCKLALFLFNRNKDFTAVLEKAKATTEDHPNFRRSTAYPHEAAFQCHVRHRDDERREMTLTVLAFDVPSASGASA